MEEIKDRKIIPCDKKLEDDIIKTYAKYISEQIFATINKKYLQKYDK